MMKPLSNEEYQQKNMTKQMIEILNTPFSGVWKSIYQK